VTVDVSINERILNVEIIEAEVVSQCIVHFSLPVMFIWHFVNNSAVGL
jgi:hypothetical protein